VYKYAGIIVNNEALQLDRIFTYEIPEELRDSINMGLRVKVPFGKGNSLLDGFVIRLYEDYFEDFTYIKKIKNICDEMVLLNSSDIELIEYMREKYLCTYIDAVKTIIPTGTIKGVKNKLSEVISLGMPLSGSYNKEPYLSIYNSVKLHNGLYNRSQLSKMFGVSMSSVNTMIKYGFLKKESIVVDRYNNRSYKPYERRTLNTEQKKAVDIILNSESNKFLIHGVTGSGKTEVYMHLVNEMMDQGRNSIILVPEISLTPQMVERFKGRFGSSITVFHSKLSEGERYDEWLRVKQGKVKVAIGARSAIFLPFSELGLIVIDEEHENSYKSDSNPKYDARDVAFYKSNLFNAKVVLGSATPSMEMYHRSIKKEITLVELKNRADNGKLPQVEVIDMRKELLENNKSIFSRSLYQGIKDSLLKREQIILFLNRRGFSTFVSCRKCGYVFKCGKCDISMTYHVENNRLSCHYCGSQRQVTRTCPKCGSNYVKYFGAGTEKIETEIKRFFSEARVIRMDFDSTRKKDSYEEIYNTFKDGEADILVGTQMIAKGLDFPNVTLVGVLAADMSLNLPDYKSSEKTFQLLTQVAGRAGRGKKEGKVIIQTYSPEHYSIIYSKDNNYEEFFQKELSIRRDMDYPPFTNLMLINFSSKQEELLVRVMQDFGIKLKDYMKNRDTVTILGPCPSPISKIKEHYRWQLIIKGKINNELAKDIKEFVYINTKDVYGEVKVSIDINPNSLL
jgi:primosomal protein N' (replication factor Y) (superfamily II helicase)